MDRYKMAVSWVQGAISEARRTGKPVQSAVWGGAPTRQRVVTIRIENGQTVASLLAHGLPEREVRGSAAFGEAVECLLGAG